MAVALLARGKNNRETATELGIAERTLYNWRQKPTVQRAIFLRQQQIISDNESKTIELLPEAIATLKAIMRDPLARPSDRIAASRALINGAGRYQETQMLNRKLANLEAMVDPLTTELLPEDEDNLPSFEPTDE
jgi:transposase-like protein